MKLSRRIVLSLLPLILGACSSNPGDEQQLFDSKAVAETSRAVLDDKRQVFNQGEVFYGDNIPDETVRNLGNFLVESGYFDGEMKSVQLLKGPGEGYTFRMVFRDELVNDPQYVQLAKVYSRQISREVLGGVPVRMEFTNEYFVTRKVIPFDDSMPE